jgi:hypothetical protein
MGGGIIVSIVLLLGLASFAVHQEVAVLFRLDADEHLASIEVAPFGVSLELMGPPEPVGVVVTLPTLQFSWRWFVVSYAVDCIFGGVLPRGRSA